jgi:hypothetical protein
MNDQLTNNPEALRLFFTDDIYLVSEKEDLNVNSDELQAATLRKFVVTEEIIIASKEVEVVTAKEIEVVSVKEPEILSKEHAKQEIQSNSHSAENQASNQEQLIQLNSLNVEDDQDLKQNQVIQLKTLGREDNHSLKQEQEVLLNPLNTGVNRHISHQDQVTPTVDFKFIGNNQKKVLILVNDPGYEVSTETGREILRNLVTAMNLKTNDFALLNYAQYAGSTFSELQKFFSSKVMLIFGIEPSQLSLPDLPKNVKVSQQETTLIFTANLNKLNDDPQGKKMLWNSLKQLTI